MILLIFFLITMNNVLAQTQIVEDISYNKYNTQLFTRIDPPTEQYSFNSDHDLGQANVASGVWRIWVTAYKFSLEDLPTGYPIEKLTINANAYEESYYRDYFKAKLGLAQNNLDLTSSNAIFNASYNLITNFDYDDTISYDMTNFITQQHIQDDYFIIKAFGTGTTYENSWANLSISIDLEYYLPIEITTKNNFEYGTIKVGVDELVTQ